MPAASPVHPRSRLSLPVRGILGCRWWPIPSAFAPLLLTPIVLFVHGYHPFAGDAEIYVAGVRHLLQPSLYPINAVFPTALTRLSVVPRLLAAAARCTHLRLVWILLAAHLVSIYLFLLACLQLGRRLSAHETQRWCSALLAAACCALPVAGTALVIMDPYVTARSFATPLSLFAVAASFDRAWGRTFLLLAAAMLVHPLMGAYGAVFIVLCAFIGTHRARFALFFCAGLLIAAGASASLFHPTAIAPCWRQAVDLPQRTFLFLARWRWYEVLGLVLPLLLYALALRRLQSGTPKHSLCLACLLSGTTSVLVAAVCVTPAGRSTLVPLQVLRSFHLIYAVGVVLCGSLFAEAMARLRFAAVAALALLFAGMFAAESFAWPACNRIEWPRAQPSNPWQQAFLWIRNNTPRDAVFSFNPQLVYLPDEDEQGFRAIAERDHLADDKDAGIVAVLPQLAKRWALQRNAQLNVGTMTDAQRVATLTPLGATWLLLSPEAKTAFPCPYRNAVVVVCRMINPTQ